MDKLEKFILDHKQEFDEARAPEKGWSVLEGKINPKKNDWSFLWKVAAVLFFFSTSALIMIDYLDRDQMEIASVSSDDSIEEFFLQVIDYKRAEYSALANESDIKEFFLDLAELDSGYANLKMSYKQLESEELLEAMLENLQLRVYILNEQIEILKNGNKRAEEFYQSS